MNNFKADETKVLFITSLTEFGERYGYYVIQSLLIFFLMQHFHLAQNYSASLVGTVLSAIYISAIVGGYIADRLLNHYIAAFIGSILMITGDIILALSSNINIMFLGLSFISISTGLIKSNMSSFIGDFYDKAQLSESHRDFGFTIFYIGINLGNFSATFLASSLKQKYGFSVAFFSSCITALVMITSISIGFFKLRRYISTITINYSLIIKVLAILISYIILIWMLLKMPTFADICVFAAGIICVFILFRSAQNKHWKNVAVASTFFILSIIYWAIFFQMFISLLLFIDNTVSHQFLGFNISSSQFLSVEPLFILIFGGIVGKTWLYYEKLGKPVHDIDKFNVSFLILTSVLIIILLGTVCGDLHNKVPAIIIIITFIILAISELCLSAIGLSLITKIAPDGFVALYMGIWLVTLGIGGKFAGLLAKSISITNDIYTSKINMTYGLIEFIVLSSIASLICLIVRKKVINSTKLITK